MLLRRVMWIGAAMCAAWGGALHAQPARLPVQNMDSLVARASATASASSLSLAQWKVPSAAYARERKAMLAELRLARALWARRRPAAYAFRVDVRCPRRAFCRNTGLKITVPGDPRVAASYRVPASIEEAFAELEDALRSDRFRVSRVYYHPRLGYPIRWMEEYVHPISPGPWVRWVRGFHPLPPPRPGASPARRMKQTAVAVR